MIRADFWPALLAERFVLLAGEGHFVHMGERFRQGSGIDFHQVVLLLALLAVVVGVIWLLSRHIQRKEAAGYNQPRALFRELCRAHELDWSDRRLLLQVAHLQRITNPTWLFVQPELWNVDRLEGGLESQRARVAALRDKLFAPAPAAKSS